MNFKSSTGIGSQAATGGLRLQIKEERTYSTEQKNAARAQKVQDASTLNFSRVIRTEDRAISMDPQEAKKLSSELGSKLSSSTNTDQENQESVDAASKNLDVGRALKLLEE